MAVDFAVVVNTDFFQGFFLFQLLNWFSVKHLVVFHNVMIENLSLYGIILFLFSSNWFLWC